MSIIVRSIRNVLRNPLRLFLVVLLLGVSLMFVAAMVGLNNSAQQQITSIRGDVNTAITINYATNVAGGSNTDSGQGGGGFGGFGNFNNETSTPIPESVMSSVQGVDGVVSVEANLVRSDTDGTLKTSSFQTPNGRSITIPPTINGISNGATHFTLGGGSTPTIVAGRAFQSNDASADVAMLSQSLATSNNLNVGSTFALKGTTLTVIGLYTTGTSRFANNTITLPLATMQHIYSVNGVDSITAYAASADTVQSTANNIEKALGNQYDVVTQQTFTQNAINAIDATQNTIQFAMIVSIITAAIVIIFAVVLLVRERTTEIGTLKAIGASHWQVIRQFWSEVLTLSLMASALAVILLVTIGPFVIQQFNSATRGGGSGFGGRGGGFGGGFAGPGLFRGGGAASAAAVLTPQNVLLIVGLGIALALLTSVIPAWYVARLKPAEVLRKGN